MVKQLRPNCNVCGRELRIDRVQNGYCSKKCQASVEGYGERYTKNLEKIRQQIEGSTAWRPLPLENTLEIVTANPVLVLGDIHCPIHSKEWAERAILAALKFECKHVIINGDLLDASTISKHLGEQWRRKNELNDDIEAAGAFVKILCTEFEQVSYTLGNHSQRLIRGYLGEVAWNNLVKMIYSADNFKATEKHFCTVNRNTRVLHPRSYSRIRGKLTADYAQRYQCHVVTGHHHHSATSVSSDGLWQAVEVGCLADISQFGYAQYSMNGMPEMLNGFAIILPESEKNVILNFNKFSPWKRYGL